jgi:hypothetical protein
MTNVTKSISQIVAITIVLFAGVAMASPEQPVPRISVMGEGRATLVPDMAVMTLTVTREGETARAALDENSSAMAQVIATMRSEGVAERDLQTSGFSIQPKYVYPKPRTNEARQPPRIVGYTVRNSLSVRVRDLQQVGALLDRSVSLGVNEGGNIRFTNDDPAEALSAARTSAVKDARARAATLASAAGVKLGDILEMSEHSRVPGPRPMAMQDMAMSRAAEAVPVAVGENSYTVTVNVSYAIVQ